MGLRQLAIKLSKVKLEGALYKKAMVCRTGDFEGINGEVTVTKEMLEKIAERYNRERATPQNEFDFAPLLLDHIWDVENTKGRVLADMAVEAVDPAIFGDPDGTEIWGLFCTLRIDNEDAQKKVETGVYVHVSISFNEETYEVMEVSFVGVEAARRSIILSHKVPQKGERMEFKAKYEAQLARNKKLLTALAAAKKAKGNSLKALSAAFKQSKTEISDLSTNVEGILTGFKSVALSAQLRHLVRLGKMTPAELKDLDAKKLAAMPEDALKIVLSAYEKRQASADMVQHGQSGSQPVKMGSKSGTEVRNLIKLQKAGKVVQLSAEEEEAAKKAAASKAAGAGDNEQGSDQALSKEELDSVVKEGKELLEKLKTLLGQVTEGEQELKKLSESEEEMEKLAKESEEEE